MKYFRQLFTGLEDNMFEEFTLMFTTETKNNNGEVIESITPLVVAGVMQKVSQEQRNLYGERGLGKAVRFKVSFLGGVYNIDNLSYFLYNGRKYSVQDFDRDVTATSYYIEGTTLKGRDV